MEYKVNDFVQNSIQQFGMSELSVKQYASTFQAMGTAMDIGSKQIEKANSFLSGATDGYVGLSDSLSDVSLNLTKLTADIASFYDKDQADVAKDLQSVFTGMVVPLRKYGLDLTQATLKEWAMKNGNVTVSVRPCKYHGSTRGFRPDSRYLGKPSTNFEAELSTVRRHHWWCFD